MHKKIDESQSIEQNLDVLRWVAEKNGGEKRERKEKYSKEDNKMKNY